MRGRFRWLLALGAACGLTEATTTAQLVIKQSAAERSGGKRYFVEDTAPFHSRIASTSSGLLWSTAPPTLRDYKEGEERENAITVTPFKKTWKVKLRKSPHNDDDDDDDDDDEDDDSDTAIFRWTGWSMPSMVRTPFALTIDAPVRVFVRSMSADVADDASSHLLTVTVRGDSKEIVDGTVAVVVASPGDASGYTVRIQRQGTPSTVPLVTGRVLVQILVNAQWFVASPIIARGDSVVVLEDAALWHGSITSGQGLAIETHDTARLFAPIESAFHPLDVTLQATDASALVLQSTAAIVLSSHLKLQARGKATLALVTKGVVTPSVEASASGSASLCVHTAASSSISAMDAFIKDSDGGLLEWTAASAVAAAVNVAITNSHNVVLNLSSVRSTAASATLDGGANLIVLNTSEAIDDHTASPDNRIVNVYPPNHIEAVVPPIDSVSRCSIATLVAKFPLPQEHTVMVAIPPASASAPHEVQHNHNAANAALLNQPLDDTEIPALTALPVLVPVYAPSTTPTETLDSSDADVVAGSLHMLGSVPYLDAIALFLAFAWILHHLLQCYDRRQRRHHYRSLEVDRVWI